MLGRRIIYLALLVTAVVLHFAYGQYVSHYMVIFLLCAPVLSVLLSLPAAFSARTTLLGGEDVCRGRQSRVRLEVECDSLIPPEAWSITVEAVNQFTGETTDRQKVKVGCARKMQKQFSPDTSKLGSIRYHIKRAFIFDHLGIIPIPVKKGGSVSITVLPDREKPSPEPDLVAASARMLKPKPQGFSEEHELRPYHEGDPLNLIHWKLSHKTDGLIVREPQEVIRKDIILLTDPPESYEPHRSVLEQICYLNDILADNQIEYLLQYGGKSVLIDSLNDYEYFMKGVLSEPMRAGIAPFPEADNDSLVYRIRPGRGKAK